VQAWVKDLSGKVGPQTVSDYTSTLSAMFASAVEDGRIARNPVSLRRLTMPVISQPKLVPLTIPQVLQWAGAARPHVRAMILTQAGLGLRISELIALRKADVDFLRREVHITEQLDRSGKRAPLKTSRSRRDVPLPVVTSEVLARHIEQHPPGESGLIFTQVIEPYRADGAPNRNYLRQDLIREDFTWSSRTAARAYRKAAQAAGLPDTISSHDLRHHYASVLLDAGESVHAVAERLGDTAEMVLRIYGHVMPDREDTTRKAVDAAWQAAAEASPDAPDRRRLAAVSNLDDDLGAGHTPGTKHPPGALNNH
jgi:integrase